jgi:hypothetical protein
MSNGTDEKWIKSIIELRPAKYTPATGQAIRDKTKEIQRSILTLENSIFHLNEFYFKTVMLTTRFPTPD